MENGPDWGTASMAVESANIIPICSYRKGKGLVSHENKPFIVPFGGDKRDRTADLLNAIERQTTFCSVKVHDFAHIRSF